MQSTRRNPIRYQSRFLTPREAGDLVGSLDDVLLALKERALPSGDAIVVTEDDFFDSHLYSGPEPARVQLTPEHWRHPYEPEHNRIVIPDRGGHVYYCDVRIPCDPVEQLFFGQESVAGEARRVGRPSLMDEIEREMRRRAEAGQLAPTLAEEGRQLAEWASREFRGKHAPEAKSITSKKGSLSPCSACPSVETR